MWPDVHWLGGLDDGVAGQHSCTAVGSCAKRTGGHWDYRCLRIHLLIRIGIHIHNRIRIHTHTHTHTRACPELIGDQGDVFGGQCPLAPRRHYGNRIRSGSNGRLQFEASLESCNCLNSAAVLGLLTLHCPSCCRLGPYSWLAIGTLMMSWHIGFKLYIQIVRGFSWAPLLVIFLPLM